MKSSTYAVLIGVYMVLLGPLLLIWPAESVDALKGLTDHRFLLLVGMPFVMISVLVLLHPNSTHSGTELLLRILACLTILKLAVFIWCPGSLALTMKLVDAIPLVFFRGEGLVTIALGGWLIWWGAKVMRLPSQQATDP
jgi:hypothetical protein